VELSGPWRAHAADDELRRTFVDDAFDDARWVEVTVPGHWRTEPTLVDLDGPVLYRTKFVADEPSPGTRTWLIFDGIFSQGDVWLDGVYLGDTEGYAVPHRFEITELLATSDRTEHVLAVEVTCPPISDTTAKRALTGAFQYGDHVEPRWNPGGIWRPVRLECTGPLAVRHARLRCLDADEERATLGLRIVVDSPESGTATFVTRVVGPIGAGNVVEHELLQPIAAGENRVTWTVPVPEPSLWWPHALGEPSLYSVEVELLLDDGTRSDGRRWRTGLRTVELRGWTWYVNGERLFLKGANLSPTRPDLAAASVEEMAADLHLARDAGLDLVRLHTHVSRPELYDAADELGLLVWQDLPLHRKYARSVKAQAVRQTREAIDLLAHHPSVALWCAHNEPYLVDEKQPPASAEHGAGRRPVPKLLGQQLPSWNRAVLDRAVKRELDGTDSHLWFGWYGGQAADIEVLAARVPREVRFVSEFGAQALPDDIAFCDPASWPDLDWARLARDHGMQVSVFERVLPHQLAESIDQWQLATQQYQAQVIDRTIRSLRRLKYHPTGGFALYRLVDTRPDSVGFGVLDHLRRPKAGWHALVEACKPAIVAADPLPERLHPGEQLHLDVHVVNDLRVELDDVTVEAVVRWSGGGEHRTAWLGAVEADACVRVGCLDLVVPNALGVLDLTLTLQAGDHVSIARDVSIVS
jgi:beta-mannosidase